mgnify:CR=1 FL=1
MNIKQEAEFLGKAVTRMDGRADTLINRLERENLGLRQQNENLKRKDEAHYRAVYGGKE